MATACLIFSKSRWDFGLDQIVSYFKTQYPNTLLQFAIYIIEGNTVEVDESLDDFLKKYPKGQRVIVSDTTAFIVEIDNYLKNAGLSSEIASFSISASSPQVIEKLSNSLTLGYFITNYIISSFLIVVEYDMKNVVILYDPLSPNGTFINESIQYIIEQCKALKIPFSKQVLKKDGIYNIPRRSAIYVLCETVTIPIFFNPQVLNSIPPKCYISLSTLNFDIIVNPFGNKPCFVPIPTPINFTQTSQEIYSVVKTDNKYYGIYAFWDILVIFQFILDNAPLQITIQTFSSVNAFNTKPAAWINSADFNLPTNGIKFGTYDLIFVSNVFFNPPFCYDLNTYLRFYKGGIMNLPNSFSVFRTIGLIPFFNSPFYYVQQDFQNVYNENKKLLFTCFEKSIINYPIGTTKFTNVAEVVSLKFLYSFQSDGYFNYLSPIVDYCFEGPSINSTMSKIVIKKKLVEI